MSALWGSRWKLVLALGVAACTGSSPAEDTGEGCARGSEGCACGPASSCDPGLDCRSKLCVDLSSTGGSGGAAGTSGGSSGSGAKAGTGGTSAGSGGETAGTGNGADGGTRSGSGGLEGTGPGPNLTIEEYCERSAELESPWCDYLAECCSADDIADLAHPPPVCAEGPRSATDCRADFQPLLDAGAVWDGTWANACVAELSKLYPSPPSACTGLGARSWIGLRGLVGFSRIPACRSLLRGTTATNEPCEYNNQCEPGSTCFTITGEAGGDYECLPAGTRGSKCVSDTQCELGLFCVGSNGLTCGDLGTLGSDCIYSSACEDGLYCTATGTCVAPKTVGEDCDPLSDVCDLGLGCNLTTYVCEALRGETFLCDTTSSCLGRCDTARTVPACTTTCGGNFY
jgi:hypothetical protein